MASLIGWLGNGVKRLENTVNNDVVQPVKRDVVQPIQRDVIQPIQHPSQAYNPAINQFKNTASDLNTSILGNLIRIGSADITHNPIARANASQYLKQNYADINQRFTNPIAIASSFSGAGVGKSIGAEIPKPNLPPNIKQSKFVSTVKKSPNVSPAVAKKVSANYKAGTNIQKLTTAEATLNNGLDKATNNVNRALNQKLGTPTPQELTNAIKTAEAHDTVGNTDTATNIYNRVARHLTASGQRSQVGALISSRSPLGLRSAAERTLEDRGVTVTPNIKSQLDSGFKAIKSTKPGTPERELATRQLADSVTQSIPRGKLRATAEFWRAMLISGPTTAAKVAISQPVSGLQAYLKQYPAGAFDATRSALTGAPRTTAIAPLKGISSGLKESVGAIKTKMKTGVDVPGSGGFTRSFEQQIKTGAHQTPIERGIMNLHSSLQKPVSMAIRNNVLARLGKTQAINQGLKGAERQAFVDNYIKNPPPEAYGHALEQGAEAVNQQKTALGSAASNLQRFGGKNGGPGPGIILAPITRVPGAIATNALYNYSGLRFVKTAIVDGLVKGGHDPALASKLADSFGQAVVGAGGVASLGAILGATGNLTPPKASNTKEAALLKAEGKPTGSFRIPGTNTWISLNALGPVGIELAGGGGFGRGYSKQGLAGGVEQGAATAGQEIAQQPYLQGISGVGNALNDPKRYAASYINSLIGSVVPAASGQTAVGIDKTQRQVNYGSATDVLKSRIPGVRQGLPIQNDVLGQPNVGANPSGTVVGGVVGTLDALKATQPKPNDPVTNELDRLYKTLPSADSPAISAPTKNQNINGQPIVLNDKQLSLYTQARGQLIHQGVSTLINDPSYQSASDIVKSNAINDIIKNASESAKQTIGGTASKPTDIAQLTKSATLKVQSDNFVNSGKNFQIIGNNVWTLNSSGNPTHTTVTKYQSSVNDAQLTQYKGSGNLRGWQITAQKQLLNLQAQLNDPNASPLDQLTTQNKIDKLQTDIAKYSGYGSFTKAKSARGSTRRTATAKAVGSYKTSVKATAPHRPKGVSVHIPKASFKAPKTKKLSVSKIPVVASKRKA